MLMEVSTVPPAAFAALMALPARAFLVPSGSLIKAKLKDGSEDFPMPAVKAEPGTAMAMLTLCSAA